MKNMFPVEKVSSHLERIYVATQSNPLHYNFYQQLSAIHSLVAIREICVKLGKDRYIRQGKVGEMFDEEVKSAQLLQNMRNHDLHVGGLTPLATGQSRLYGQMHVIARRGTASATLSPEGVSVEKTGNSTAKINRPVYQVGNSFKLADESSELLDIHKVIKQSFTEVMGFLSQLGYPKKR